MIIPVQDLERQTDALAHAQRHWKEHSGLTPRIKAGLNIAITREAGTDAAAVAAEVGKRLGWPVYDRNLIERIAREMGLRTNLIDAVDERRKSWLLECVEAFTSAGAVTESKFVHRLIDTLLSLGGVGHCIVVGRGGALVLPAETTLRVRLVGAKQDRIAAIQRQMHLTASQAAKWVDETDRERTRFVKAHFFTDPTDASLYDLILNVSRWTPGGCADFIVAALKNLEARQP